MQLTDIIDEVLDSENHVTVIGGSTGQGKTDTCCKITASMADYGRNVWFVSDDPIDAISRKIGTSSPKVWIQQCNTMKAVEIDALLANGKHNELPNLLVLDSFNEFSDPDIQQEMMELAREYNMHILISLNLTKEIVPVSPKTQFIVDADNVDLVVAVTNEASYVNYERVL